MNDTRFRLRVCYSITGRLRYLSQLEVARCIERSIRRARLPFMVSQGFSPHMRTAFGWALPVGVAGEREFFDILLYEFVEPQQAAQKLTDAFPVDMAMVDCWYVDPAAKSLADQYPYATYICEFEPREGCDQSLLPALQGALNQLLQLGQMEVRRKKKTKIVKFEGLLKACQLVPSSASPKGVQMQLVTFTEGKGSLRPDIFCGELLQNCECARLAAITRVNQTEDMPKFVEL